MSSTQPSVLIVEDSRALAEVYLGYLTGEPYRRCHAVDLRSARTELAREPPSALLLDLPDREGMAVLRHIHDRQVPTAVVVAAAASRVDLAMEAIRCGACDFLEQGFGAKRPRVTLRR